MTRLIKFIVITILFSFIISSFSFGQQKETIEGLSRRIRTLENQNEKLKNMVDNITKDLESENNIDIKLKHAEKDQDRIYTFIYMILGVLIGIIVANFGAYLAFFKHMKKKTEETIQDILKIEQEKFEKQMNQSNIDFEKQMNKKIENYFQSEEKNLAHIVQGAEEYNLKQDRSILVLSNQSSKLVFIKKFFNDMRFNNVTFQTTSNKDVELNNFDLILFNDEDDKLSEKDIFDVITGTKATIINFYFGPKRINPGEYNYKTTFANARVQLYGNLINALRYQKLLK